MDHITSKRTANVALCTLSSPMFRAAVNVYMAFQNKNKEKHPKKKKTEPQVDVMLSNSKCNPDTITSCAFKY